MRAPRATAGVLAAAALALGACEAEPRPARRIHGDAGPPSLPTEGAAPAVPDAPFLGAVFLGTTRYRVLARGADIGRATLTTSRDERRALVACLDLDFSSSGMPFCEERRLVLGPDGALRAAAITRDGVKVAEAFFQHDGAWWTFVRPPGGDAESALGVPPPRESVTRLGFVLAAAVAADGAPRLDRVLFDEAALEAETPPCRFEAAGERDADVGGARRRVRVVRFTVDGERTREVLIGEGGRVVRLEWNPGVVFEEDPTGAQAPAPPVAVELPGVAPSDAWRSFTEPTRIATWWAPQARVDIAPGGAFVLEWPERECVLRGAVRTAEPGRRLVVEWRWDHDTDMSAQTLCIELAPSAGGTRVEVSDTAAPPGSGGDLLWRAQLALLRSAR